MRPCRQNPTPFGRAAAENDPAGVALLIQSARQAPDEPLPLVKWRIRNSLRRRSEWNRRGLRLALVGALFLCRQCGRRNCRAASGLAAALGAAGTRPRPIRHRKLFAILTAACSLQRSRHHPLTNQSCRRSRLLFQPRQCYRKLGPSRPWIHPRKRSRVGTSGAGGSVATMSKVAALHPSTALKRRALRWRSRHGWSDATRRGITAAT